VAEIAERLDDTKVVAAIGGYAEVDSAALLGRA
jgi:hypothetical protein